MIKLSKENSEYIAELRRIIAAHDETGFGYNGIDYGIDYKGDKIWVYENADGGKDYYFENADDFFYHFMLDGKPFIERLDDLTEY